MAGSVNRVFLIGRVGKDPEIRSTQSGGKIANLSLATSDTWMKDGERVTKTEWHKISCMNDRTSDVIEKYVTKGALVAVEGSLQTQKWTDKSGNERYTTEVVIGRFNGQLTMLDSRSDDVGGERREAPQQQQRAAGGQSSGGRSAAPQRGSWGGNESRGGDKPAPKGKEWAGPGSDLSDEIPW